MTALWILGCICLLLLLLSRLRFRVGLAYREDSLGAHLRLGVFRFQLYPEKKKKTKKTTKKVVKKEAVKEPAEEKSFLSNLLQNRDAVIDMLGELLPLCKELLGRFQEKLRVDLLEATLICAQEDPADAAIFYGHANAVAGTLLPLLERWFTIKKKEIEIKLDFEREKPQFYGQVQFSLTMGQMLTLGAFALTKGLGFYRAHRAKKPKEAKTKTAV